MSSSRPRDLRGPPSRRLPVVAAFLLTALIASACGGVLANTPASPGSTALRSPACSVSLLPSGDEGAPTPGPACSAVESEPPKGTAALSHSPVPTPNPSARAPADASANPSADPSADASPSVSPSPAVAAAPTSPVHFPYRRAVVPMAFPLPSSTKYSYRSDFLVPRVGKVYPYNHARSVAPNGTLRRAHDGVDLNVPLGTAVRAPFSGTVIDPATRWKPWDPARYGKIVVIVSDEPASRGYSVLLAHLSKVNVKVGQKVARGQVVGKTGKTGNAAGTPPHLHLELRAPFLIRVREAGTVRKIDAFDPYPSLVAADPKR